MPYLGEIRMFAINFPPVGWAFCNGGILSIRSNPDLFKVIGTFYGGDGRTTFALPNLAALAAIHWGSGPGLTPRYLGQVGGKPVVTLTSDQLPAHSHAPAAAIPANASNPTGAIWSNPGEVRPPPKYYATEFTNPVGMVPTLIGFTGGNLPHNNLMPFLVVNFCIAIQGDLPGEE